MRLIVFTLSWLAAGLPLSALDASKPLTSYQRQNWQTESGLPQNTVHAILQTHDGYLWLATEGGLVRFDGLKFTVYDSQNTPALRSNNIRALLEDNQQALWIGTADGLTVFRAGGTAVFTSEQGLPSNSIWSIEQDGAGHLSVLTARGLAKLSNGRFENRETKDVESSSGATLKDSHGALWIANRGVKRMVNGKVETFPANDPLANDVILSLFEDREGDMWLGSESNGVTVLRDQKITTYTTKDGLTDDLARCVYEDRHGAMWFGTNGGLTKIGGRKVSSLTVEDGLSSNLVFALGESFGGDLLVGTQDGLNVIHDGKVKVLTTADGLPDDLVRSLHTDADGSVWIGTRRGLTLWKGSTFHTYTEADGLGSDLVGALTRDRDGALWVGTLRGLTRIKDGHFQTFTGRDGLASNVVTALHATPAAVLWIGTQDGGLHRMQNGKIFHFPSGFGLPASIFAILENGNFLWLTSKTGIYRVAKTELDAAAAGTGGSLSVTQYGTADGMRVNECSEGGHPAAWRSQDGALWFATLRGVSTIDGQTALANGLAPLVAVESFSVDDRALDLNSTLKSTLKSTRDVPPGHDRLSFEYTGSTFVSPQRVRFRYMLEGFDHTWVDAGTRRTAYYTSLPPAEYRFRVTARVNDGDWSAKEGEVAFRLLPRFYQTYWFYLLSALGVALAVYGFYRWRVSQVEAQFNAVLAERNRIAREIHDTLAQGFVAVSLQLELLSRKLADAPEGVRNLVGQTRGLVQSGLEEARRSIWELRSQGSDSGDFRARLSRMAADIAKRAGLNVQFSVLGTYRELPEKIESEFLKIGQEAVTNVVRHANAKQVKIDLAYGDKKVRMTIADDGCGFEGTANSSGPDGHFGLRGMRERAAQIGAQLAVKSQAGEGTQIDVEKIVP
jgi:signal transduction histidine kinase/ligand-binding sensor domain-containing protein